jgi:hypothetical protein
VIGSLPGESEENHEELRISRCPVNFKCSSSRTQFHGVTGTGANSVSGQSYNRLM